MTRDQAAAAWRFAARNVTAEVLAENKALDLSAAGVCFAIILLIAQMSSAKVPIVIALWCAAAALPLWLSLALMQQLWILFKVEAVDLKRIGSVTKVPSYIYWCATCLLFSSIGCVILSQSILAFLAFVLAACLGVAGVYLALGIAGLSVVERAKRNSEAP